MYSIPRESVLLPEALSPARPSTTGRGAPVTGCTRLNSIGLIGSIITQGRGRPVTQRRPATPTLPVRERDRACGGNLPEAAPGYPDTQRRHVMGDRERWNELAAQL